uniref:Protein orai n=1 Tax=Caenorhabditis tropicalis TaxID=1561998 RepID=A0A1I7UJP3_9PELO
MPIRSWNSASNLSKVLEIPHEVGKLPNRVFRTFSLGSILDSQDDHELFYTPRATIRQKEQEITENATKIINGNADLTVNQNHFIKRSGTSSIKHRDIRDLLKSAKRRFKKIIDIQKQEQQVVNGNRRDSRSSLVGETRVQFALSQTPPVESITSGASPTRHHAANTSTTTQNTLSPVIQCFQNDKHRGELDLSEKYNYDLSKAQLKASSRTSALLAGFAMVCLVELQYDESTSKPLLIVLGVVTSLLVSVHLLALMMSTCILPYMEATGCTQDSPHLKLKFYIDLSWLFSTCIGLLLFLVEIGVIFYVKFTAVGYPIAGYITTAMLIPVGVVFVLFSYLIHKNRVSHSLGRFKDKVDTMKQFLDVEANLQKSTIAPSTIREI